METGKRIMYFRTQKNYSVNKLANLAGISQSYIIDIELGNKNPTVEVLSYICEALNISLKEFFDDKLPAQIKNDPLIGKIYKLTPKQKLALEQFIDTLVQ